VKPGVADAALHQKMRQKMNAVVVKQLGHLFFNRSA